MGKKSPPHAESDRTRGRTQLGDMTTIDRQHTYHRDNAIVLGEGGVDRGVRLQELLLQSHQGMTTNMTRMQFIWDA